MSRTLCLAVKRLKLVEIHPFNISANAAFAKRKSHPRFEARDDSRLHFGMLIEVIVQAVSKCVHQLLAATPGFASYCFFKFQDR